MNNATALTRALILQEAVEDALQANCDVTHFRIGVAVQGATVSLRGQVASPAAKMTAEQLARHVDGVLDVTNELIVAHHDRLSIDNDPASSASSVITFGSLGASRMSGGGTGVGGMGAFAAFKTMAAANTEASADYRDHEDTEEVRG